MRAGGRKAREVEVCPRKVSRSKTEYMCLNERNPSGTVRLQGSEKEKVEDFKYRVNSPEQRRAWKRGEEACASKLEWLEKSAGCDV